MTHIDVRTSAPFSLINFLFSIIKFHFVEKFGSATTKGRTESRGLFVGRKMFKLKKFSLRHFQPAQCTDLKTKSHKILKKGNVVHGNEIFLSWGLHNIQKAGIPRIQYSQNILCTVFLHCCKSCAMDIGKLFGRDMIWRQRVTSIILLAMFNLLPSWHLSAIKASEKYVSLPIQFSIAFLSGLRPDFSEDLKWRNTSQKRYTQLHPQNVRCFILELCTGSKAIFLHVFMIM